MSTSANDLNENDPNKPQQTIDISDAEIAPLSLLSGKRYTVTIKKPEVRNVQLAGMIFDSNKCFLLPQALPGIRAIINMHKKRPDDEILIVGHDGSDEDFAGVEIAWCRADIISHFLSNNVDAWAQWFKASKPLHVRWGTREVQLMLSALPEGGRPFYIGMASGVRDEKTREAVVAFQEYWNAQKGGSLVVDGKPGPKTQNELITAYMDLEDTSLVHDVKTLAHGCEGQFEEDLSEQGLQPDARVLEVLFFEKGIKPEPPEKTSRNGATEYFTWTETIVEKDSFETHGIHVQIIDKKKNPVKSCKITLNGPTKSNAVTDEQGFAFFSGLLAGTYSITAEGSDIGEQTLTYPTAKTVRRASSK